MPSSPPIFSSDFEVGVSSDALSASSHLSARNTGFLPLSDMGPPRQNNPREFGGFFSPPGGDPMRSQQMFMGSSSVRTLCSLWLIFYIFKSVRDLIMALPTPKRPHTTMFLT
jgi:hypothetical protein